MKTALGHLKRLDLRQAWKHEATEFTPWLAKAENLNQLADTLGLAELALVKTEYVVGDFKLDILCADDDGEVIIENQLEKTNHGHLGQIITYAAGVGAKKIIWVAESFRAEHVAALDFLNQNTTDDLNFFAVEIELWQIGDSPMAPSFNVVVKPNNWSKTGRENARAASASTPIKQLQLQFWTEFVAYLETVNSPLRAQTPRPQHWLTFSLGRGGYRLTSTVNSRENRMGAEINIHHDHAKDSFRELYAQRVAIEQALEFELNWMELPDGRESRIVVFIQDMELENASQWSKYFAALHAHAVKLDWVFRPLLRSLEH